MRNRLLTINMIIILSLIFGSFSVIYIITSQKIYNDINRQLDMAINSLVKDDTPPPELDRRPKDNIVSESEYEFNAQFQNKRKDSEFKREYPFSSVFRFMFKTDGSIDEFNQDINIADTELIESIRSAAYELSSDSTTSGSVSIEGSKLDFRVSKTSSGTAVVLGDFNSEHEILRNLIILLTALGLITFAAALMISLITANRSIRPVAESYNKQKQFVADASHELKTPLTTINTNIDVLLSHEDSTIKEEKKWLEYIKDESKRMSKLTNDLLYLARLDHNEDIVYSPVSFSESAENVLLAMEAVAFEKNITIDEDIEENVIISAAQDQLKQLIMILIDNAIKYTPQGGNIGVSLHAGKHAVLKIRNSGDGMSEDDMKMVFERFYRSDKSRTRDTGGYGLGLAIAKAIAKNFQGDISVSSQKGAFTEFTVSIPTYNL